MLADVVSGKAACARTARGRETFTFSLLALLVGSSTVPWVQAEETIVVQAGADTGASEEDYSPQLTTAGTKMLLMPRDVPQSLSVITQQRMKDQDLQTVGEVMQNTTGVSARQIDSNRVTYYSRGFLINNYLYDDIPTTVDNIWNFGDAASDTAIYDRIDVVRGASGLLTGTGNPSASVNMVRKHATRREATGQFSVSVGSWDKRRVVADVSAPLTQGGDVRGRMVTGYQEGNSWLERYSARKKFFYGVIDADLGTATTASIGYEYQQSYYNDPTWGGLPTWYADGTPVRFDRSVNPAPDWAYSNFHSRKVLADITHRFDNDWQVRLNGTHAETVFDSRLMYAWGYPDRDTGDGMTAFGGWNKGKRKLDSLDLYASGPFELLGQRHEMIFGGSYSKQNNHYFNSQLSLSSEDIGNYFNWNGHVTQGNWSPWVDYSNDTIRQRAFYGATRLTLVSPVHLILGARWTNWRATGTTAASDKSHTTPYAGLVYDINDTWSAYASYTAIFQPVSNRDASKNYLAPTTGDNYETGVKADWLNGRLNASFAVFRIEQDNLPVSTGRYIPGTAEFAYRSVTGTVSKGVEFEVNGRLTDDWQMTVGGSRFIAEDKDGNAVNPFLPRTTVKLFTRYRLPVLPELTLGGGVNWQNHTWESVDGAFGHDSVNQGSYALINLFARYQFTRALSVQANVNNLFDKEYYDYLATYAVYGTPRNVSLSVNYDF